MKIKWCTSKFHIKKHNLHFYKNGLSPFCLLGKYAYFAPFLSKCCHRPQLLLNILETFNLAAGWTTIFKPHCYLVHYFFSRYNNGMWYISRWNIFFVKKYYIYYRLSLVDCFFGPLKIIIPLTLSFSLTINQLNINQLKCLSLKSVLKIQTCFC